MRTSFGLCVLAWMLAGVVGCGKSSTDQSPPGDGNGAGNKPSAGVSIKPGPITAGMDSMDISPSPAPAKRDYLVAHVFVCLCDNRNQSAASQISGALGNGQDPSGNLYWGAASGVKTFLGKSSNWKAQPYGHSANEAILDQAAFVSNFQGRRMYVLAQAYDGAKGLTCANDFVSAAAGALKADLEIGEGSDYRKIPAGGQADIVCFVGHTIPPTAAVPTPVAPQGPRYSVVLACKSNTYSLQAVLDNLYCPPLVMYAGTKAMDANTLEAILMAAAQGNSAADVREKAALAYQKGHRCTIAAARKLFVGN